MEVGNGVSPGVDFPGLTIFYDISATSAIFDIGKYSANSIFFWGIAYQKELDAAKSQSVDQGGVLPPVLRFLPWDLGKGCPVLPPTSVLSPTANCLTDELIRPETYYLQV